MLNTFSFINKFFWKNPLNIFFALILPFILVLLANITFTCSVNINDISGGGGIDETATFLSPVYVVPGIATLSLICLTCLSLPLVIYSFKRADVLKRITMKINNNWMFYSVIGFYYIILCIFSYAFAYFLGSLLIWLIDHQNGIYIEYMLNNIGYGQLFFSLLAFSLLGIAIGILMATLLNSIVSIQILGAILVLFSIFLGGGGIPLQYLAMYSQDSVTHQFKNISIWTATYLSPFRYPTCLLLESVTQGPAFNAGKLSTSDWNEVVVHAITGGPGYENLDEYSRLHLGYSSIFDVHHAFTTNIIPIPYFNIDFGGGYVLDTWYPRDCQGYIHLIIGLDLFDMWEVDPILYGLYWSGDVNAIFSSGIVPSWLPINNIPTFTFAQPIDKLLDLIIPFALSSILLSISVSMYKSKVVNLKW